MKKLILVSALIASSIALRAQTPADGLKRLFADYWEDRLRERPELATTVGRTEYNHLWRDRSKVALEAAQARRVRYVDQLKGFDSPSLSQSDRLSLTLLRYQLQTELDGESIDIYLSGVSQFRGLNRVVYDTIGLMPTRTVKDYEALIARLDASPDYVDQHIQILKEAIGLGIVQPRVIVDLMLGQIDTQIGHDALQTPLLAAVRAFPATIPAVDQEPLRQRATRAYSEKFVPAWKRLGAFLRKDYAPKARPAIAANSLPGGQAYAFLVARETTTRMTPQQIHQLGLDEVQRLEVEMQTIAKGTGFVGSLPDFEAQLDARPGMRFQSKEEMLAFCRNAAKIAEPQLPILFKRLPRMPFGIRAIPDDFEAATASNYQGPAADGSRAGYVNMNTYRVETQVKYDKEAVVLHEGVPGHHLQIALAAEMEGVPEFRKRFAAVAFSEGWGLYAESLGAQLGLYRDPYSRYGQLASERFRAVRLVVDTGMHEFGWSRQQATDYLQLHAPTISVAEIDRYIAQPAQALGYKIGELKFKELRHRAETALGPRFDIREFHDVVLRNGTLPLDLLDQQVDEYVRAVK